MKRIGLLFLIIGSLCRGVCADWEWMNPKHGGSTLYCTWGTGPDDIYAGGDFGSVCHFDGTAWTALPRVTDNIVLGMWGAGSGAMYAVAGLNGGEVLKWNGSDWKKLIPNYPEILIDIWGFPNGELFVLALSGTVLHFNGSIWETIEAMDPSHMKWCIWGPSPEEIYVAGESGVVYRLDPDGWQDISTGVDEMIWGVWGFSENDLYAVMFNGWVCHWNGTEWRLVCEVWSQLTSIWGPDPEHLFFTGGNCDLWMWDGSHLKNLTSSISGFLFGVWGSSDSNVVAVGESGNIFHWNGQDCLNWNNRTNNLLTSAQCTSPDSLTAVGPDGYVAWVDNAGMRPYWSGVSESIYGIWSFSDSNAIAVGENGTALHWDGVSWHPELTGANRTFQAIWGQTPDDAYAVGYAGLICHWNGITWQVVPSPVDGNIRDIHGCSESCIFAVGDKGTILSFDGLSWHRIACPVTELLEGVWCCSPLCAYAVGINGVALEWNGKTWTQLPAIDCFCAEDVFAAAENDVYVTGPGFVKHWDGANWENMISDIFTCHSIWGTGSNDIYSVGENSQQEIMILHWDGSTWTDVGTQDTGILYCAGGSSTDNVLSGGANGLLLKKSGSAWETITIGTTQDLYSIGMQYDVNGTGELSYLAMGLSEKIFKYTGDPFDPALDSFATPSGFVLNDICNYHNIDPSGNTPYLPEPGDMPLFICGNDGVIFQGDGVTWTETHLDTDEDLTDLWFNGPDSGFCVGNGGVCFQYDGTQWTALDSGTPNNLLGVWGTGPDDAFAVGAHGTTIHWNGSVWEYQRSGVKPDLVDVWGDASNHVFAVGGSGTVIVFNGAEWQSIPFPGRHALTAVSGWSGTGKIAVTGAYGIIATLSTDYPEPTPTPTPECSRTQVTLQMPRELFHAGDACWLTAEICNAGQDLSQTAFYVLLYAAGEYFFYPRWCLYPDECPELDYKKLDIPAGLTNVDIISEFVWPVTGSSANDLYFFCALIDVEQAELIGDLGWVIFGFDS